MRAVLPSSWCACVSVRWCCPSLVVLKRHYIQALQDRFVVII